MTINKNLQKNLILSFLIWSTFFSYQITQAQNCNSGELGWNEISNIFTNGGCTNCHGMAGGFNLNSYASFMDGGTKCGSEIIQGKTFLNILTIDGYDGCSIPINGLSMNNRVEGALDSLDLLLIQRWINAGIPELCESFCIEDEMISTSLNTASYHFVVDNILSADNVIINSDIIYEAGERINLDIGFDVDVASDFHAFIGACD